MNLRKTVSLTTLLSFIVLLATSVVLYLTPQGKVAFWANWKMMGLTKEQWGALHTNIGILFIIAGLVHTILNGKAISAYLKNRSKEFRLFTADFNAALIITLTITVLTLLSLPPVSLIQHQGEAIKTAAAQKYGDPPYGHAESSTLETFCRRTGIELNQALSNLNAAELKEISASATLADMSEANGIPPQQLYNLMAPAAGSTTEHESQAEKGVGGGMGFGKKTLKAICAENGLDPEETLQILRAKSINATLDQSIRDLADAAGIDPPELRQIILPNNQAH